MKTIGIIGSRRRDSIQDYEACLEVFGRVYESGDQIVSGGCPKGGDRFAELIAKDCEIPLILHKADWDRYGRGAGYQRNGLIAKDADILIAIVAPDRLGGTEDTIRKAEKLGKKVILVT